MFFLDDQHAHLLTPTFVLSGILSDPPTYDKMTPEEMTAFLTEMEPDIRAADRDMLEIDALERKGVLGSGKLPGMLHPVFLWFSF
jgi:Cu+-exporting ATPase